MAKRSSQKKQSFTVSYRIEDIDVLPSTETYESQVIDVNDKESIKFSIRITLKGDSDKSNIAITIHYFLKKDDIVVYNLNVQTTYHIISGYSKANDEKFVKHLVMLSVHHARGVQAIKEKGNDKYHFLIPLVDPERMNPINTDELTK